MARKKTAAGRKSVCVLSSHPFVLRELERVLAPDRFRLQMKRVASSPLHESEWSARAPLYVVDAQLPRPTSETLISTIARRFPRSRILVVSDHFREAEAFGLLRLGVKGLVPYSELSEKLPLALDTVAAGGFWAPRSLLSRFFDTLVASSRGRPQSGMSASITGREREVLETLLENLSNKQIADRLHISERTVKAHLASIYNKLGVDSRAAAIAVAAQRGLLKNP